ncbi:spore germination protein [Paenibacillus vortex V453]|uniref:Spore germination protein n=2 Tax=Paenibacillus TaxID=44249 RepID=A0A2R9SSJ9_9BACL|nr:spore germination protein [Paenibacillus vortex V453]
MSGIAKSSLFSEMLVFGFLLPRMRKSREWGRAVWWCIAISSITLFSTTIVYLYVFPYPTAIRLNVPMFEVSRLIIFGRWIQRLESLFLIAWLISAALKLAIGLYCTAATMSQILRLPRVQTLIFPLTLLVYGFALLPNNEMTAVSMGWRVFAYLWIYLLHSSTHVDLVRRNHEAQNEETNCMKLMRRIIHCLLIPAICIPMLTGCWDRLDPREHGLYYGNWSGHRPVK